MCVVRGDCYSQYVLCFLLSPFFAVSLWHMHSHNGLSSSVLLQVLEQLDRSAMTQYNQYLYGTI